MGVASSLAASRHSERKAKASFWSCLPAPHQRIPALPMRLLILPAALAGVLAVTATASEQLMHQFCGDCHSDGSAEGGIAFDHLLESVGAPAAARGNTDDDPPREWIAAWKNLRAETMPPADHQPQPTAADRRALVAWIEQAVFQLTPDDPDPGRVVLRRLNRTEYVNSVSDLTGINIDVTGELPPDDTGHGFDTIGSVLSTSPLLVERYLALADMIGQQVLADLTATRAGKSVNASAPATLRMLLVEQPPPGGDAAATAALVATIERIGRRGFRRPLDDDTRSRLLAVARRTRDAGGSVDEAVVAALTAVLASPRFLFRDERADRNGSSTRRAEQLDEFSLASRLSYFLWSTMPDEELFELAAAERLRASLSQQIDRMIADPRCDAFGRNFVGQWLQIRDVMHMPFDLPAILKETDRAAAEKIFNADVRRAMQQETELLFLHLLRNNLPAADLLVGDQTFLNEPLARFYGIEGITGNDMRLVSLRDERHRHGLLTHGSVLAVTSNPSRTSPVKRGLFILENLLGTPPPPAPPDVPPLEATALQQDAKNLSMRALLARHRQEPLCHSCHARFDPLGLALEQYNAIGQWQTDGIEIETAGTLITGESFSDVRSLARRIAEDRRDDFYRCLTEKLLTYALGRGVEYYDAPAVDKIVRRCRDDGGLRTLVTAVLESVPFQMRRIAPHGDD